MFLINWDLYKSNNMIVTILAEPRSGSTNLARWFQTSAEFTVYFEPVSNNKSYFKKFGKNVYDWRWDTTHFVVKETYHPAIDYTDVIGFADKVIILYRENAFEQIHSFLNAKYTNNWSNHWVESKIDNTEFLDTEIEYFELIKEGIRKKYILDDNPKFFKISYENIYYGNGINRIIDFLGFTNWTGDSVSFGSKYKIDNRDTKIL